MKTRGRADADAANLLLHPVRMRVVVAMATAGPMTVQQLQERLGDVPPATLYRHVGTLADGGVLRVVGERTVRATIERTYALDRTRAQLTPTDVASVTPDDLVRAFSTFVATLVADYAGFVGRPDNTPGEAAWFTTPIDLSDDQFATFGAELQGLLQRTMTTRPGPGSRRRALTTILIPEPRKESAS